MFSETFQKRLFLDFLDSKNSQNSTGNPRNTSESRKSLNLISSKNSRGTPERHNKTFVTFLSVGNLRRWCTNFLGFLGDFPNNLSKTGAQSRGVSRVASPSGTHVERGFNLPHFSTFYQGFPHGSLLEFYSSLGTGPRDGFGLNYWSLSILYWRECLHVYWVCCILLVFPLYAV